MEKKKDPLKEENEQLKKQIVRERHKELLKEKGEMNYQIIAVLSEITEHLKEISETLKNGQGKN